MNNNIYLIRALRNVEALNRVREQMFNEEYIYDEYKDEPYLIKCHEIAYEKIYEAIKLLNEIVKYEEGK